MNVQTLAALLNGRQYRDEMSKTEEAEAEAAGLVVVFGASDDLMEFRGAIHDEIDVYDGETALISPTGLAKSFDQLRDEDASEEEFAAHFAAKADGLHSIEAMWCKEGDYSWTFKTAIPHATFDVVEDTDPYCRGIVFDLNNLNATTPT